MAAAVQGAHDGRADPRVVLDQQNMCHGASLGPRPTLESQCGRGAHGHRQLGRAHQRVRDGLTPGRDPDRVAPAVQVDALAERGGAHPVAGAPVPVDGQDVPARAGAGWWAAVVVIGPPRSGPVRCAGPRPRPTGGRRSPGRRPAPCRPSISSRRLGAPAGAGDDAATAGSPRQQGPHCPAVPSASSRAMPASASHAGMSSGIQTNAPAPQRPPSSDSASRVSSVPAVSPSHGTQRPCQPPVIRTSGGADEPTGRGGEVGQRAARPAARRHPGRARHRRRWPAPTDPQRRAHASAIRANVSALLSITCERRRATPVRIDGGRPRSAGRAGPPVIARITAVASPATNVAGPIDSSIGRPSWRSARAIRQGDRQVRAVGADPHDDPGRPEGSGRGDGAVEDQVRDVAEQDAVLAAGRLPLGAVDDHVRDARAGQRGQLAIGRERRTAGTDDLIGGHPGDEVVEARRGAGPQRRRCSPTVRRGGRARLRPGAASRGRAAPWGAGRGAAPEGRARAGPGPVGDRPWAATRLPAAGAASQGLGHRTTPAPTSSGRTAGTLRGRTRTRTARPNRTTATLTIARACMTAPSVPTSSPCPTASAHTG